MATILEAINEPLRMRRKGVLDSSGFASNSFGDSLLAWATYVLREFYLKNPNAAELQTSVTMNSTASTGSYTLSTIASNLKAENIRLINHNTLNYVILPKSMEVFYKYWNPTDNPDSTHVATGNPSIYFAYGTQLHFHPIFDTTTTSAIKIFYSIPFTTALVKENFSNEMNTLLATTLIMPEHNRNIFSAAMMYAIDEILPDDVRDRQASFGEWFRQQRIVSLNQQPVGARLEIGNDVKQLLEGIG
jgi:hypothetical protein